MSSSPKKERPSAEELALARQAASRDQRYEAAFRPLEQDAINELQTADAGKRSAMLAGRSNADLEAQAHQGAGQGRMADAAAGTFGSGSTVTRGFRHAGAVMDGRNALHTTADQQARDSIDQDTLNVIKTGQGVARGAQSSLTAQARMANEAAANKLRNEQMVDGARMGALMEVGMAAGFRGYDAWSNNPNRLKEVEVTAKRKPVQPVPIWT